MTSVDFFPTPAMLGLALLALALYRRRKRTLGYRLGLGLLGLYLMALVSAVFFPLNVPEGWPGSVNWDENVAYLSHSPSINLIPFQFGDLFVDTSEGRAPVPYWVYQIGGNILLTVPLGLWLGVFAHLRARRVLAWAFGAGLAMEGTQFLCMLVGLGGHSVDVNDVLLNALGVLVGWGGARLALRLWSYLRTAGT